MNLARTLTSCASLLLVTGCPQHLSVEPGPNGSSEYCTELSQSLPVEISGELLRTTTASDRGVAAWGDPAIVLRCGVEEPMSLQPTSQLLSVNGVDWLPEELTQGQRFTTINTLEFVEVDIPSNYESSSGILVDLADAFPTN